MRAFAWNDPLGVNVEESDEIPAELGEQASEYLQLIDAIAEKDEELLETYLEDEDAVTPEMIRRALRKATRRRGDAGAARLRIQGHQGHPAAARRRGRLPAEPARRSARARP